MMVKYIAVFDGQRWRRVRVPKVASGAVELVCCGARKDVDKHTSYSVRDNPRLCTAEGLLSLGMIDDLAKVQNPMRLLCVDPPQPGNFERLDSGEIGFDGVVFWSVVPFDQDEIDAITSGGGG